MRLGGELLDHNVQIYCDHCEKGLQYSSMQVFIHIVACCLLFAMACTTVDPVPPPKVEVARLASLRWIKQQQKKDGHWGEKQNMVALTSLAALAFLSNQINPGNSPEFSETLEKALSVLLRDVESGIERTNEDDALLAWCLSVSFEMTLNPNLSKALTGQTNRLDFTQATRWHLYAAWELRLTQEFNTFGKQGIATLLKTYPCHTNDMMNQSTCLLQGMYGGDSMRRDSSLKALRQMDLTQWKAQDYAMPLALLLSQAFYYIGGQDWRSWNKLFYENLYNTQTRSGKRGWWTPESLGITTRGLEKYTQREREVYITSIALLAFPPERHLSSYIREEPAKIKEETYKFVPEPGDIIIDCKDL